MPHHAEVDPAYTFTSTDHTEQAEKWENTYSLLTPKSFIYSAVKL